MNQSLSPFASHRLHFPSPTLLLGAFLLTACGQPAPKTIPTQNSEPSPVTQQESPSSQAPPGSKQAPGPTATHAEQSPGEPAGEQKAQTALSKKLPVSFSCGPHQCMRFNSAREALFPLVLEKKARVIGFGEAHAPADFDAPTTVQRFTEQLLPTISAGSTSLFVELLAPPAEGCADEKKAAEKESQKITQGQSKNNQNEYLKLGERCRELGIVPDILRASCEDMERIAAPDGGVLAYMETIAQLFSKNLQAASTRTKRSRPLVLAYGGALHNDASPRTGRESWSYGPALLKATGGAYLEVDLIIPELIGNSDSWKSFAWYDAYAQLDHQKGALLMQWGPHSYSLFFAPMAKAQSSPSASTP